MGEALIEHALEAPGDLERILDAVKLRQGPLAVSGLRGAARAALGARLVEAHRERPVLFLTATAKAGDALLDDLRSALGENGDGSGRLRFFPRHDTPPYDRFSPQPFVVAQRMDALYRWLASAGPSRASRLPGERRAPADEPAPVVVAPWTALCARVPSRDVVRARSVHLEVGQTVDRDALIATLVAAGYQRMALAEERGELAVRGGILDVFPPQRARPVRIELLGDEVESIREFDAASQRSQGRLGRVVAPPPRELLFDRDLVVQRSAAIRSLAESQRIPAARIDELLDGLLRGHVPPGAEALAPLLQPSSETLLDFLPDDTRIVVDDLAAGRQRLVRYFDEALTNFDAALEGQRPALPPAELLLEPDAIVDAVLARNPVILEHLGVESDVASTARFAVRAFAHDELRSALTRQRTHDRALEPLVEALERWREQDWRVVLAVPALSAAERLRALLAEYGVRSQVARDPRPVWRWSRPGYVEIRLARVSQGFALPIERLVVITEEEIFGPRHKRRVRSRWHEGPGVEALGQLETGDPLVHAEHGIGTYRGLVELEPGGVPGEFLRLEYLGGDRLFLPVHRLNLVQRYVGADGHPPRLDRLGGTSWGKTRRSVKKSLKMMASELLKVHAARELAEGFAFSPRDRALEEFEGTFPYEETPDQAAAIEDVVADMQKSRPMDRLVCGDVGYGKTEVAVRAAFRSVMDGKQVAVLVPTTILAQQHEETFQERFEGHPVRVESFSRFRSNKESTAVLEGLASGTVDIVIGTHRLLQKSVVFRDLGLLVVDEEHRFGVRHKERIKQLKKTVDVLTLTATPIPRTLQMAFTGLRDLSVIETPPENRLAIRTQVCRFSEELVREAILREVRRGGQVFFVHNRVQSIGAFAELLGRVVPEVRVIVAHGQMRERELEERMLAFGHGEADVLLCTTIVESGLDIPRANTILIDRGDRLGLAQLYQLRGRVGRSSHRAYAYIMVPGEAALSHDAQRRLQAIQDLSELGSGFRLANMDLEIRGAGNLLGGEQSGNLAAVGYETYMDMLTETVEEMRGNVRETQVDPEIRLPVAARLPESFVEDVSQRLVLYKRLASSPDDADVDRIRDELLDRYGPLPVEAEQLLEVIRLKIHARALGIAAVDWARGEIVMTAGPATRIDPKRLVGLMTRAASGIRVAPDHKIYAPAETPDPEVLFPAARRLLQRLAGGNGAAAAG
ncbi:MAG: transcription-repair coupling factor [Deltaproteobacteria bacterium]|nr:transcription-repair coupling factor [Deltaproteobacteria bacterium]